MTHVAVVLSGCGFMDGSEIHESVLCLLALSQEGCSYQCFAPDIPQAEVINHLSKQPQAEKRNALVEAARIARGEIKPLIELNPANFDAILLPGGAGAAKTLSTYAQNGPDCQVNEDLKKTLINFHAAKKPIGACCIAPAVLAKTFQKVARLHLTLGSNPATKEQLKALDMEPEAAEIHEVVADREHKVYTTPCYMEPPDLAAMYDGVRKLVKELAHSV